MQYPSSVWWHPVLYNINYSTLCNNSIIANPVVPYIAQQQVCNKCDLIIKSASTSRQLTRKLLQGLFEIISELQEESAICDIHFLYDEH